MDNVRRMAFVTDFVINSANSVTDFVITGAHVVTMDGARTEFTDGYVAVTGNTITAVGQGPARSFPGHAPSTPPVAS